MSLADWSFFRAESFLNLPCSIILLFFLKMSSLSYVPWLSLVEYIAAIFSQTFSLWVFSTILFRLFKSNKKITVDISPNMILYIIMQILTSLTILSYLIFLLIGWKISDTIYNAHLMFFIGTAQTSFLTAMPLAMLGLGLDRCLCLLYPIRYTSAKAQVLVFLIILSMAIVLAFSYIFRIIPAYPTTNETKCLSFGCTTTPQGSEIYTYIRYLTSSLILITSGFLLYLVRYKLKFQFSQKAKTQNINKLVLSTLTMTFVLDFLPHLCAAIFNTTMGINLVTYVGPYSTVISSFEAGLCGLLYRKVFKLKHSRASMAFSNVTINGTRVSPKY